MTEKTFMSKDGRSTIHYYVWEPEGEPVAILQITHGMAEHLLRYEPFAEYLNKFGILVCGHDHIGHGRSADPEDWGYFGEENGWKIMVQDVEQLHGIMKVRYMDTPYFLMGHSMGSFIARAWLSMYGNGVDGAIIMGTAGKNSALGVAKGIVKFIRKTKGSRHISKLITNLAFGSYNKRIKPARTAYDWLTRDEAIVDRYVEDPACGFTFTAAGYADLFNLIGYISSEQWYNLVPRDLPILLVSGAEDPVGAYGAGPAEVAEGLEAAGCTDVSLILYEGMRHEILNENGREAVMEDLKRFILGEEAPAADSEQEEEAPEEEEKVFYPSEAEDTRAAAEKAFESAAESDQASPDISGAEKKEVPHKGVRGFGSEFSEGPAEKDAPSESELKLKAALKGLMEEPDLEVEAPAQDNRPAAEKAMESAVEAPAAPDLSGVEKADVPHLGIRKLYETVDGMAEDAAEAVKEEVAKISEQAEELASKYDG